MKLANLTKSVAMLAILVSLPAASATYDDATLKNRILGAWHGEYTWNDKRHPESWIKARSQDRYQDDGSVLGNIDYEYPDRADTVSYTGRWDVRDGYLVIEITRVSGGYLKSGTTTRDKIVSASEEKLELQSEDGEVIVLRKSD
ncbi:MAG: hypothetical protein ACU843_18750 [Gammaproteobacteria bacterium]